jgi:cytochrome P450
MVIMSLGTVQVRTYPFGHADGLELDGTYAYLREHEPLAAVQQPFGDRAWLVTRYDDVRLVLSDARFSRAETVVRDMPRMFAPREVPAGILNLDPPEHTRIRRLVSGAFRAPTIELLRARVEQAAAELLDSMVQEGPPADLVEGLAIPLPLTMICELMGVPYGDRENFQLWADAYLSTTDLPAEEKMARLSKLGGYIAQLVAQRRQELAGSGAPVDDLIGVLVQAREQGSLTEEELIVFLMLLLAAGYETISTQLTNSVYMLLTHPEQLALLRNGQAPIPNAVEELLRYVPTTVAAVIPRYATEDVELSGGTVRAGEAVLPSYQAANRDPRVFDDPERFDLTRAPQPSHIAFGNGTHFCLGAQLARIELQVALGALLRYFPHLRLAEPDEGLRWKTGLVMRGPVALPIAW